MRVKNGFTLMEMTLVVSLIGIITISAIPLSQRYFVRGKLSATIQQFVSTARYAQTLSQSAFDDTSWGVYVGASAITLFRGSTYATRSTAYDQSVAYPTTMVVSGTVEYDFLKRTGRTTGGTITFTDVQGNTKNVQVNTVGMMTY